MLFRVIENHPNCPLTYFRWVTLLFVHDSILSNDGASSKPGAIHRAHSRQMYKVLQRKRRKDHPLTPPPCSIMLLNKKGGDKMLKEIRVNAVLDPDMKKRLYRVLLEEDLTFSEWLRRQIDAYLKEKEPKGKRRKGTAK